METATIRVTESAENPPRTYPVQLLFGGNAQQVLAEGSIDAATLAAARGQPDADPLTLGVLLFGALDASAIGPKWAELRRTYERSASAASNGGKPGLRTILELPESVEDLPWELLVKKGKGEIPFFRRPENPCCRRLGSEKRDNAGAGKSAPPGVLRVLLVVGAKEDDDKVRWQDELSKIMEQLRPLRHAVDIDLLLQPSLEELRDRLRSPYEIFHFIGHGKGGTGMQDGCLVLHASGGGAEWWTAEQILEDVQTNPPRLAVLNACATARATGGAWDVACAFARAGTPFVLAMTDAFDGELGAPMASRLYESLKAGEDVDVAATRVRIEVKNKTALGDRTWSLPRLLASECPAPISIDPSRDRVGQPPFTDDPFHRVRTMFDRFPERQKFLSVTRGATAPSATRARLVVVHGRPQMGKTALVTYCLERLHLEGRHVSYVDIAQHSEDGWLDLIRRLPRAISGTGSVGLPPEAFHRFHHAIRHVLGVPSRLPPPWDGSPCDDDPSLKVGAAKDNGYSERFEELSWGALVEGLAPVDHVLALDSWMASRQAHELLLKHLLKPLASRPDARIRVVLVTSSEIKPDLIDLTSSGVNVVELGPFRQAFGPRAVVEVCEALRVDPELTKRAVAMIRDSLGKGAWPPGAISQGLQFVEVFKCLHGMRDPAGPASGGTQ